MNKTTSLSSSSVLQASSGSQFKHTNLWNNIISNLRQSLNESHVSHSRLKKQHSRLIAAGVGGMLLIKQNFLYPNHTASNNCAFEGNTCFTGAQCVDIVYEFLTSKENNHNFERQVTREKVCKLLQLIMDSGVFESLYHKSTRFEDSSLKFYRFKHNEQSNDVKKIEVNNVKTDDVEEKTDDDHEKIDSNSKK